ncbi:MAG: hypothetical protein ACK5QT_04485 [Oligoflexia bacterium]
MILQHRAKNGPRGVSTEEARLCAAVLGTDVLTQSHLRHAPLSKDVVFEQDPSGPDRPPYQ